MNSLVRFTARIAALLGLALFGSHAAVAQMPSSCVVGTNVYYISQAGSDSNSQSQAKSKSTPWKHAPYMASFTGSYSHSAGDCFIFRGGDTWTNGDSFTFASGGNSSVQDYYGVDTNWSASGTWSRPIFDVQSIVTPQNVFNYNAGYITVDNWEVRNMACDTGHSQTAWSPNANHGIVVTNSYVHLFQPGTGCGKYHMLVYATGGNPPCDGLFDHNVVNGADGGEGYFTEAIIPNTCDPVTHNVFHDLCSAVNVYSHMVAYNTIYNIGTWGGNNLDCEPTFHPDGIQDATDSDIHDNVLWNVTGEIIEVSPQAHAAWPISHVYNNIIFYTPQANADEAPAIEVGTGGDPANTPGVIFIYNNTMQCDAVGNLGCIQFFRPNASTTIENNHQINATGAAEVCLNNPPFNNSACPATLSLTYNPATELYQTPSQAKAANFNQSGAYVYAPSSSSSPTVGIGANLSGSCTSVVLMCSDTEYGSNLGTGNVSMPGRTPNGRSGSWDAGAYQFPSSGATAPSAPTSLSATVQ